jgi:hypothetical protein
MPCLIFLLRKGTQKKGKNINNKTVAESQLSTGQSLYEKSLYQAIEKGADTYRWLIGDSYGTKYFPIFVDFILYKNEADVLIVPFCR